MTKRALKVTVWRDATDQQRPIIRDRDEVKDSLIEFDSPQLLAAMIAGIVESEDLFQPIRE